MTSEVGLTRGRAPRRRHRLLAIAAAAAALVGSAPTALADEATACVGQSCAGTVAAVSTLGDASSSSGVAVSAFGNTHTGSGVGVSLFGRAYGNGPLNVSSQSVRVHTGLLPGPATTTAAAVPTTDVVNPVNTAEKLKLTAQIAAGVAQNLATGAGVPAPSPGTRSSCPDGTCRPPMNYHINHPAIAQTRWYYCVPASVETFLRGAGASSPSQDTLATRLGTKHPDPNKDYDPSAGTPSTNAPAVINKIRTWGDTIINGQAEDAYQLMNRVVADVYHYRHGMILPMQMAATRGWSGREGEHAVVVYGYNHRNGGTVLYMDPYEMTRFNWSSQSWGGPNPFGAHEESLGENIWPASAAMGGSHVW